MSWQPQPPSCINRPVHPFLPLFVSARECRNMRKHYAGHHFNYLMHKLFVPYRSGYVLQVVRIFDAGSFRVRIIPVRMRPRACGQKRSSCRGANACDIATASPRGLDPSGGAVAIDKAFAALRYCVVGSGQPIRTSSTCGPSLLGAGRARRHRPSARPGARLPQLSGYVPVPRRRSVTPDHAESLIREWAGTIRASQARPRTSAATCRG